MPGIRRVGFLAPAGSTGNNTHAAVAVPPEAAVIAVEFEVEAVGGTPTVSYNVQGSNDEPEVPDASSDWFEVFGLPSGAAAEIDVSGTVTTVSVADFEIELARRPMRKIRLVTTANTNVTYNGELWARG